MTKTQIPFQEFPQHQTNATVSHHLGSVMSFIRPSSKDTPAYHDDAPKRASSFVNYSDKAQLAPRLKFEGNNEYEEARQAFSVPRGAVGSSSKKSTSAIKSGSGFQSLVDDDSINSPSIDDYLASPPLIMASRGEIDPPKVVHGTAPGGLFFDGEKNALAVATEVNEDYEFSNFNGPHAYYHDDEEKHSRTSPSKRCSCIIAACVCALVAGMVTIIWISMNQSSKEANSDDSASPTFAPSTNAEAVFMHEMSIVVGDGVFEENSYLGRSANWIMYTDPTGIGPFDPHFIQRFLLAVFYFATTDNMSHGWRSCSAPVWDESANCSFGILTRLEDDSLGFELQPGTRWLSSESECIWAGVTCNEGHVSAIELGGQNMTGTLPPEIALLPFLQSLSLHYNQFIGAIPVEYSRMRYLINLALHGNRLNGTIPSEIFSIDTLEALNLGENQLTGTISTLIGQLTGLKGLHLDDNTLEGSIPTEIGDLLFLTYTRWSYNLFAGSMPTSIAKLTALRELWLQNNAFTGSIPSQLVGLQALEDLQLFENQFSGILPEELYDILSLERLELSENDLSGTISTRIGQLIRLRDFRVARNAFTGTIPTELTNLSKLRIVWLHLNKFDGEVPPAICNIMGEGLLEFLNADCGPEGNPTNPCECCTGCCDPATAICLLTDNAMVN